MRVPMHLLLFALLPVFAPAASADDAGRQFALELNALGANEAGCRISFVATNALRSDLEKASFEVVLFNSDGLVEKMLVLDFGALPAGKTKVRQFDLSGLSCERISRLLVNDVAECKGADVARGDCLAALTTSNRTAIRFGL